MQNLCSICEVPTKKVCQKCRSIAYCSVDHQRQDYARHKLECDKKDIGGLRGLKKFMNNYKFISYKLSCCIISRDDIIIKVKVTSCPNTIIFECIKSTEKLDKLKTFILEYLEDEKIKTTKFEMDIYKTIELEISNIEKIKEIENCAIQEIFKNRTELAKFINKETVLLYNYKMHGISIKEVKFMDFIIETRQTVEGTKLIINENLSKFWE